MVAAGLADGCKDRRWVERGRRHRRLEQRDLERTARPAATRARTGQSAGRGTRRSADSVARGVRSSVRICRRRSQFGAGLRPATSKDRAAQPSRPAVSHSALRTLGGYANVFAAESFMDELADAAGADPVEFRLRHLSDPRARRVIETAVRLSHWQFDAARGKGRAAGIGFARYKTRPPTWQ